jgi:hypothetical protein
VALDGDGVAVTLKAAASTSFAAVAAGAGTVGKPKNIEVSNPSRVPVTLGPAMLGGADPGSFAIVSDGCADQPLAPKGKCSVAVEFAPPKIASGAQSSSLS